VLQREIAHLLVRPAEWPSQKPIVSYHDFAYRAQSWNVSRRVVAKVEWHQGELFARVGFIVTNLSYAPIGIVRFYNGRGTAEQWIKEGKYALNWTRLSCHKFVANQVRLGLFILAYNLGNFMRRLALPEAMKHWSLTSLQTRLLRNWLGQKPVSSCFAQPQGWSVANQNRRTTGRPCSKARVPAVRGAGN
jgi:hypothetical protein